MQISELLGTYQMSVGSMIYCLKDIEAQLPGLPNNNPTLEQRVQTAAGSSNAARGTRFRWNVQDRTTSKGRSRAVDTDNAMDKTLSAMHDHLVALGRNGRRPRRQQKARELKNAFFLNGVRPLSGLNYEDQLAAVEEMLDQLDTDYAAHVSVCGLSVLVEQLRDLADQFTIDLDVRQRVDVTFDQVKAAEALAREDFNHVLVTILADYREAPERLASLLEQFYDQQERIALHMKRNGSAPEIDPDTGEIIEPGSDEPQEPADDDSDEPGVDAADDSDEPVLDDPIET